MQVLAAVLRKGEGFEQDRRVEVTLGCDSERLMLHNRM